MSSTRADAVTSLPFVAARGILNTVDKVINPLCHIPVLATPPRIVQIAINSLGLVGVATGGAAASVIGFAPLPGAIKRRVILWKEDASKLRSELVNKIARLSIDAIPLVGPQTLKRLDAAVQLRREYADLQGKDFTLISENKRLHEQNQALMSDHQQIELLTTKRRALEHHAAEREQGLKKLAKERTEEERAALVLQAQVDELQEKLKHISKQIQSLTAQMEEKQKAVSEFDRKAASSRRGLETSAKAIESARVLEEKMGSLRKQMEDLLSQQASLEETSAKTAQHIESLIASAQ